MIKPKYIKLKDILPLIDGIDFIHIVYTGELRMYIFDSPFDMENLYNKFGEKFITRISSVNYYDHESEIIYIEVED